MKLEPGISWLAHLKGRALKFEARGAEDHINITVELNTTPAIHPHAKESPNKLRITLHCALSGPYFGLGAMWLSVASCSMTDESYILVGPTRGDSRNHDL